MAPPLNPWEVLGVSKSATPDEIKEQWRRLCKQHHPDLQPEHLRGAAEQYFKEISSAYRALSSRGAHMAGYADFTAAAAAAARSSPYGTGFRSAWAAGGAPASKWSNGVVAAVFFLPLVLTGMWMAARLEQEAGSSYWRPHGLLAPPENPFLRDDMKPRVYSHMRKREEARQRQLEEEQAGAAAAPGARPAAAAAAAPSAAEGGGGPRRWPWAS